MILKQFDTSMGLKQELPIQARLKQKACINPPGHHNQDLTQGQFFRGLNLV